MKSNSFLSMLFFYLKVILLIVATIGIPSLPVIPYILTDDAHWMIGLFITFPIGLTVGWKLLEWVAND